MEVDIRVERDLDINAERFDLVITTESDAYCATTAVHRSVNGYSIGGNRAVALGTINELGHLSSAMTGKCRHAGIQAGGQKTLVVFHKGLPDRETLAQCLVRHIRAVIEVHPRAIHGPDMNCGEDVQDEITRLDPSLLPHVTGLSSACNGLSIDAGAIPLTGSLRRY